MTPNPLIAGLFDAYPQANGTKMIVGQYDSYSILEIETYKPSNVVGPKPIMTQNSQITDIG